MRRRETKVSSPGTGRRQKPDAGLLACGRGLRMSAGLPSGGLARLLAASAHSARRRSDVMGQAWLISRDCRQPGQRRSPARHRYGKRNQPSGTGMRHRGRRRIEHGICRSAQQGVQRCRGAGLGAEGEALARRVLEQRDRQVLRSAGAGMGRAQPPRVRPRILKLRHRSTDALPRRRPKSGLRCRHAPSCRKVSASRQEPAAMESASATISSSPRQAPHAVSRSSSSGPRRWRSIASSRSCTACEPKLRSTPRSSWQDCR